MTSKHRFFDSSRCRVSRSDAWLSLPANAVNGGVIMRGDVRVRRVHLIVGTTDVPASCGKRPASE
jgi:hypothetical protein